MLICRALAGRPRLRAARVASKEFVGRSTTLDIRAARTYLCSIHFALPWFVTGALIAAIGLGWAGGWNLYRLFVPSAKLQQHAHRDDARGRTQEIALGATNEISLLPSNDPDPSHSIVRQSPASDAQPSVSSPVSPIVQQNTTWLNVAAAPVQPAEKKFRPRITPTPDTRPKTIPGRTVREVFGGTAVLEGPGGIRKVSVGVQYREWAESIPLCVGAIVGSSRPAGG